MSGFTRDRDKKNIFCLNTEEKKYGAESEAHKDSDTENNVRAGLNHANIYLLLERQDKNGTLY